MEEARNGLIVVTDEAGSDASDTHFNVGDSGASDTTGGPTPRRVCCVRMREGRTGVVKPSSILPLSSSPPYCGKHQSRRSALKASTKENNVGDVLVTWPGEAHL